MNLKTFIRLAKLYAEMGSTVQEQLDDIIDGAPLEDMNPSALAWYSEFLQEVVDAGVEDHLGVLEDIDEYLRE